jgi:hypothetical protein
MGNRSWRQVVRTWSVVALVLAVSTGCVTGRVVEATPERLTLVGTLDGIGTQTRQCAWLVHDGVKTDVVWPAGWRVDFDRVQVFDASGALFAREGDRLRLVGPNVAGASDCSTSPPFVARSVDLLD